MPGGAYYRHFATKDDIVDVLFEEFADELSAALADVADLEDFCRTWLRVHEAHCGTVRAAEDVTPQDGAYWAHRRRLRKLWASSALLHLQLARDAAHRRGPGAGAGGPPGPHVPAPPPARGAGRAA